MHTKFDFYDFITWEPLHFIIIQYDIKCRCVLPLDFIINIMIAGNWCTDPSLDLFKKDDR